MAGINTIPTNQNKSKQKKRRVDEDTTNKEQSIKINEDTKKKS